MSARAKPAKVILPPVAVTVRTVQRVNVDFPLDLLREIDREAARLGVNRQAFIKLRIADALAATRPKEPR